MIYGATCDYLYVSNEAYSPSRYWRDQGQERSPKVWICPARGMIISAHRRTCIKDGCCGRRKTEDLIVWSAQMGPLITELIKEYGE